MSTTRRILSVDHVQLAVEEWGSPDRPTVVLVHGYPDSRAIWGEVAARLAPDFHVIAYDVRGAGESDAPNNVRAYRLGKLVSDFQHVIGALAPGRPVHLVGHDWGSIQGWEIASVLGARIASFTSISGPSLDHAGHWMRARAARRSIASMKEVLRQNLRSWYIFLFHAPVLAPAAWRFGLGEYWPKLLAESEGISVTPYEAQTLTKNGRNGVNLYRANIFPRLLRPRDRFVAAPVQLLIPERDKFVDPSLFHDLEQWAAQVEKKTLDAGHWVPLSHPAELATLIGAFALKHQA